MSDLILKKGKEKPILNRHPWIFSGAIAEQPDCEDGSIVAVKNHSGELIGSAYFSRKTSISARMLSWGTVSPLDAIKQAVFNAYQLRKQLMPSHTNCFRLINAEGDFLPGLIVDAYEKYLVLQIATLGMEKLKPLIIDELISLFQPLGIYEKSLASARKAEGLKPQESILFGKIPETIAVLENGLKFHVQPKAGQKTGFFLDQREMRSYVRSISEKRRVLNCFSYTGGFTVYALAGGASLVDSVDISKEATDLAKQNCILNQFNLHKSRFLAEDAFDFLRASDLQYELIILDPPAFAKQAKDQIQACRGYKEINRLALKKMPQASILITCSCSHFVDEKLFQQVVFQAAVEAKRQVRIIGSHRQACDHPINLFQPEGSYLKSLILYIE